MTCLNLVLLILACSHQFLLLFLLSQRLNPQLAELLINFIQVVPVNRVWVLLLLLRVHTLHHPQVFFSLSLLKHIFIKLFPFALKHEFRDLIYDFLLFDWVTISIYQLEFKFLFDVFHFLIYFTQPLAILLLDFFSD